MLINTILIIFLGIYFERKIRRIELQMQTDKRDKNSATRG